MRPTMASLPGQGRVGTFRDKANETIAMAVPVVGLYFLGIWGGRFVGENAERFRWWKAWPIVLALAVFVAMLANAERLNDWAANAFGVEDKVVEEAPAPAASPGG